ncbi:type II secretion system protein [Bordetella avium]|nr:type II secretion system protein [Bordetella avium]
MIMSASMEFGSGGEADDFSSSQRFQDVKNQVYEHLLSRIEELGAEFGRWSRTAIQAFVEIEIAGFARSRSVAINEAELAHISSSLTKKLDGLGPLEDLLSDPAVEDVLINGYNNVSYRVGACLRARRCVLPTTNMCCALCGGFSRR